MDARPRLWVSDVFAWRGSPAAWKEELAQVVAFTVRATQPAERKGLHRLGNDAAVAVMSTAEGSTLLVAVTGEFRPTLAGPFAVPADRPVPLP